MLALQNCINSLKVEPGSDSEMCRDGNQVIDKRVEEVRDTTVEENPMMKTFPVIKAEDEVSYICVFIVKHGRSIHNFLSPV